MTIQVALMNGYGLAMASDRHVFRGGAVRSDGEEMKIVRLRGAVPGAMMASGPFAIFGQPVSRLALRLERALVGAAPEGRPEALGEAVFDALEAPFDGPASAGSVLEDELAPSSREKAPGEHAEEFFLMVGLVCPATGVPVLVAVRAARAAGRLQVTSRLDRRYEMSWNAGRTVILAQGTGGNAVQSMIDGLTDDHWTRLGPDGKDAARPTMNARWDRAHARLAVSSPRELAGVAAGLVRGAEVLGFLTQQSERSVLDVDSVILTPRGTTDFVLAAGQPIG